MKISDLILSLHISSTVKACLDLMVPWIHNYISQASDSSHTDIKHHGPFYSLCQAVLYIFAFRHKELLQMPRGENMLSGA